MLANLLDFLQSLLNPLLPVVYYLWEVWASLRPAYLSAQAVVSEYVLSPPAVAVIVLLSYSLTVHLWFHCYFHGRLLQNSFAEPLRGVVIEALTVLAEVYGTMLT